ncbi:MAG: hypothetical protein M3258_03655 [Thermoproteota archaeon]|jgi:hypothetical protein|nr:hypothetical protein [Thermoproteota archaeon]
MATKKISGSNKSKAKRKTRSGSKHMQTKSKKNIRTTTKKKKVAINIERSSGRKEKFDTNKMTQTTSRSGVPFMMARDIAQTVSKKIISSDSGRKSDGGADEKTVAAGNVRSMIAEELRNRNEQAKASSYVGEAPENVQSDIGAPGSEYIAPIGSADTRQHEAYRADQDSVTHDQSKRHQSST